MFEKEEWQWVVVHLLPRDNSIWLLVRYWKLKRVLLNLDSLSSYSLGLEGISNDFTIGILFLGDWDYDCMLWNLNQPKFQPLKVDNKFNAKFFFDSTVFGSCQLDSPPSCVIVVRSSSSIRSPSTTVFTSCYLSPLAYFPILSTYWFFSIPGETIFTRFYNLIYTQGINLFFSQDFLDQLGINILEWPTHQDINILFLWINICQICMRANFCNNQLKTAQSNYAYGLVFS